MLDEFSLPSLNVVGALIAVFLTVTWYRTRIPELDAIPTIGYSAPVLACFSSLKFFVQARQILQEGYNKYKPGVFKIPMLDTWTVVAVGHQFVDDILKAPESVLSFDEAIHRSLQVKYTLGEEFETDTYHIPIIRAQLTRNIGVLFDDMRDELVAAFDDMIPAQDDWVQVPFFTTIQDIVCRTTNRVFVGLDICRNEDYLRLNIDFTIEVFKSAVVLNLFPDFLKPYLRFRPLRTIASLTGQVTESSRNS
ncbi:hypothetical protein BV25DRAFT_1840322 [Artomyces pyxidatus]|uniref:Uncharacterized protein n=1 Tax=Artomyces pyxidatus TaxID=48021 RepID=A0ACB8SUI8_9AGAM|nr:hypothetical protein BV25DRAFT_1840322 [Artomyces pyxidatus]